MKWLEENDQRHQDFPGAQSLIGKRTRAHDGLASQFRSFNLAPIEIESRIVLSRGLIILGGRLSAERGLASSATAVSLPEHLCEAPYVSSPTRRLPTASRRHPSGGTIQ